MKVIHIVAEMDPTKGGVCQAIRTIAAGLADLGVTNEVASLDAPDAPFLASDSVTVHALGPGRGPWFYGADYLPWLQQNLARFDVIVVHGLWSYHSYAAAKALKWLRAQRGTGVIPKLFVMPHGMLDPYFQRAAGRKLKAMRNWIYWKLIEGQLINQAAGVLFTCEDELRLAQQPFRPYQPKKAVVVGLGVEEPPPYTDAMREAFLAKCPTLRNQPYLLFLSRIHEKKGVDTLLAAYASLAGAPKLAAGATVAITPAAVLPSGAATASPLLIAGPGLETAYGQQQQQVVIDSAVLQQQVFFPGMLTGLAKWGAFYCCEAFVLPSHQENFGIAVVEALACEKAVLISNQVNIWREIEAAGGGIVGDDTLAGTQQVLAHWQHLPAEQRRHMAAGARACFTENFTVEAAAARLLAALAAA